MHYCTLDEEKWGVCRVRKNEGGKLYVYNYGMVSSIAVDPIEKKPFHHFYPGSKVLSFGGVSCNFRCSHCQNYEISFADLTFPYLRELTPEDVVRMLKDRGAGGVAWTYNEPSIWHEFTFDSNRLVKKEGYYTTYVTNGYLSLEAIDEISKVLDAANVDVKAFNEDFYRKVCKAKLEKVLEAVEHMHDRGIFLEITYLVIPGLNDDMDEIRSFAKWVASIDSRIPVHFSRFHPDFQMLDRNPTPVKTLEEAVKTAREFLDYVYIGNVWGHEFEDTYCPNCGYLLVDRHGFYIVRNNLKGDRCPNCGEKQNFVLGVER